MGRNVRMEPFAAQERFVDVLYLVVEKRWREYSEAGSAREGWEDYGLVCYWRLLRNRRNGGGGGRYSVPLCLT